MEKVQVRKSELLVALNKNREEHRTIFEEAIEGYRKEVEARLDSEIKAIKAGKRRNVFVSMNVPQDHTRDYDRAIRMIEMSIGDEITLTESDFSCYVMDDWGWQDQFLSQATAYNSGSAIGKDMSRGYGR